MDVKKTKKKKNTFEFYVVIITVILSLLAWLWSVLNETTVSRGDILIADVKRGSLQVEVEGYGNLQSKNLTLITSFSEATVKKVLLKPGARVSSESVVLILENPELKMELFSAKQELAQLHANLRQLKLSHQREILDERAKISDMKSEYTSTSLKRKAEEKLADDGIVSMLTYEQTKLAEERARNRLELYDKRLKQLTLVHDEAVNIQNEKIRQQEAVVNISQERINKLNVKAGMNGVLQKLSVDLGESVVAGQDLALVGSTKDLVAILKIPQSQVQKVKLGQIVAVNTRQDVIQGAITRIDPTVTDNTVSVEVELPANLPSSARPQSSVDGKVSVKDLGDVMYTQLPVNVKPNISYKMFRLSADGRYAEVTEVKFGESAGRFIQVLSGVAVNDHLIISDLSSIHKRRISIR